MMNGSKGIVSRFSFTILTLAKFAGTGSVFSKLPLMRWPRPEWPLRRFFPLTLPGTLRNWRAKHSLWAPISCWSWEVMEPSMKRPTVW